MQWGITNKTVTADTEQKEKEREIEEYWKSFQDSLYRYPNRVHSVSQSTKEEILARLTPADRGGTILNVTTRDAGYFDVWYSSGIVPPAKRG